VNYKFLFSSIHMHNFFFRLRTQFETYSCTGNSSEIRGLCGRYIYGNRVYLKYVTAVIYA
jgi:hypothetical protein